jgi:hypothetical protein
MFRIEFVFVLGEEFLAVLSSFKDCLLREFFNGFCSE